MRNIQVMNLRGLDLNLLAVFDAIYSEGNLTRASKKLGLSQPAMSNALSRLRLALDDPLFSRSAAGMTPTWRAQLLAPSIRQALQLVQSAIVESTRFDCSTATRTFVIAVEDYGEVVIMPRFMHWLRRVAPGVQIKIRPEPASALKSELSAGTVHLAMEYSDVDDEALHVQHLLDESFVPLVRMDHPIAGDKLTIEQYVGLPHVVYARRRTRGSMVDQELRKLGVTRKIALQVPHFLSMPLIVHNTDFICTIPERMARVYAKHFGLKPMKVPIQFPSVPLYLMWSKALANDLGHQWLRESFTKVCQSC